MLRINRIKKRFLKSKSKSRALSSRRRTKIVSIRNALLVKPMTRTSSRKRLELRRNAS